MFMYRTILLLAFCSSAWLARASADYYQVKAAAGDGIYAMMRRHGLDQYSCNFEQFYQLNKIKRNAHLVAGRNYYLPILIYSFDGKTIRSSINNDDWDLALKIQHYNEAMLAASQRERSFKSDKILWVPHHLLHCPKADMSLPAPAPSISEAPEMDKSKGDRIFPIFGPDYAYTPLVSTKLAGKVFYISAGHGGPDPGAVGMRSGKRLCEDEYAYDVSLRLCRSLVEHGATAYMIVRDPNDGIRSEEILLCDTDEVVWGGAKIKAGQKDRLTQRSDIINELFAKHQKQGVPDKHQIALMVHVDSRSHSERIDVFFYNQPEVEASRALAQTLHRTMVAKYKRYRPGGYYHGTVTERGLHMLRECLPVSVYIELANIRNINDQKRIILASNRQLVSDWLFQGLLAGLDIK